MSRKITLLATTALAASTLAAIPVQTALAQASDETIEEVVVTGSYIRRPSQASSPSPITVIGTEDVDAIGAKTIADIVQTLPINTGTQNNPDAFTQNLSTGTSNINLRGLGVSSTLVLLNSKRQVSSGATTDRGLNFTDLSSLVPLIAVDRIEILEDGAGALYGTDAVAGVVNFITRNEFEGFEVSADLQTVTEDSQKDSRVQAMFGAGNERGHLMAAVSFLDRTSLTTKERVLEGRLDPIFGDFSNAGQPGSFILPSLPVGLPPALQAVWSAVFDSAGLVPGLADAFEPLFGLPPVSGALTPVFADPNCGISETAVVPSTFPIGLCRFNFGDFFNLVPKETRLQGYAHARYDLSDSIEMYGEFAFARNRAERNNTPSFPITAPLPLPADNPFNPFGTDILFIGRAVGNGEPFVSTHDSDTWRVQIGMKGEFDFGWTWDLSYTRAINDFHVTAGDQLVDRFSLALAGLGGPGCNPVSGLAGQGACQFFNPFGSALAAAGSAATIPFDTVDALGNPITIQIPVANSQSVIDDFTARIRINTQSDLSLVDFVTTGDLLEFEGRTIGFAFGFQFRSEQFSTDFDENANRDNFLFLVGNPDFGDSRDIFAAFSEVYVPVTDELDLQVALRYEGYGEGIGNTVDPKVSLLYEASDKITLRGSYSTAFRAPSIFQTKGTQTSLAQLADTLPGQPGTPQFKAVRTFGNPNLTPEQSTAWNAGVTWEPVNNLVFNIDYWRFKFTDVIIRENPQAIITANPLSDQILRSATGALLRVNSNFTNAASQKTSGIDFEGSYTHELGDFGVVRWGGEATHILNYELIDPQAGFIDGAGSRNFTNFGTSAPTWRANASMNWVYGRHSVNFFARHISSYTDDQFLVDSSGNVLTKPDPKIRRYTTFDAQYNLELPGWMGVAEGTVLTVGVINILDKKVPTVFTNGGFDSKVHDPRQRLVYIRGTKRF